MIKNIKTRIIVMILISAFIISSLLLSTFFLKTKISDFILPLLLSAIILGTIFAIKISSFFIDTLEKIQGAIKDLSYGRLNMSLDSPSNELNSLHEKLNEMNEIKQALHDTHEKLQESLITIEEQKSELELARKDTQEASRIKSEFIANMSHEIRTPINSIVGYANLLLETELSTLQRNYLTTIQKSTLNLLSLVNNILDFSRLEAGQFKLDYIPFNLRDCMEDVISIISPLAHSKQLEFIVLIDNDVPSEVLSDPLRIKQITLNLVSNAIKFTQHGEVILRVSHHKKSSKSVKLRISVSDTGIGMTSQEQKRIFRAFEQADLNIGRRYGGTGLGLAICKKLIDQLAGKIGVKSTQNIGSTFWFSFSSALAYSEPHEEIPPSQITNRQCILFEPHPIARQSLLDILNHWNIQTTSFEDFDALIEHLKQNPVPKEPRFLIAGINQQLIEDETASRYLYLIKEHLTDPIIILTNSSDKTILDYFITQGATTTLSKPIIRKNLSHVLSQITEFPGKKISSSKLFCEKNDFSNKNILCVDDNPHNSVLIKALLENSGASITLSHDGLDAVAACEKQKFDIILMDVRMPKLDGYDATKIIRSSNKLNAKTPIIAVSAHISENEKLDLSRVGFNDYLIKPISKLTLSEVIECWLDPSQSKSITGTPQLTDNTTDQKNDTSSCPIDWDLAIKLAGDKREVAEEIISLLFKSLPTEMEEIKQAFIANDYSELLKKTHKLHGALCYCGIPRLKAATANLEIVLKKNKFSEVPALFEHLETEANLLLNSLTEEA